MTKVNQDFTIYAGDAYIIEVPIVDENEDPKSITDLDTIRWIVKDTRSDAVSPNILKELNDGLVKNGAYQIDIDLDGSDSTALNGKYYHALRGEDGMGNPVTLMTGRMTVLISGVSLA